MANPTEVKKRLTLKQETFCKLYATDHMFFGNGTQAYIKAYGIDVSVPGQYQVAMQGAAENLRKPHIYTRINELLEDIGFTDIEVDKQLAFLIAQHGDYRSKVAAIKEYNALKKRITKQVEISAGDQKLEDKIKDFLDDPDNRPDNLPDDSEEAAPAPAAES